MTPIFPGGPGGAPGVPPEDQARPAFLEDVPVAFLPGGGGKIVRDGPAVVPLPSTPVLPGVRELAERPRDWTRVPLRPLPDRFGWPDAGPQQLLPVNTTPNLDEGLEARIKDPLWFLSRQWQTGEFEAESGGSLAQLEITAGSTPVTTIVRGGAREALDPARPLEAAVEEETGGGASPAWRRERLEYGFALEGAGVRLEAGEYEGTAIDWHHFDLASGSAAAPAASAPARLLPRNLRFSGMPHPRWWRFEDGEVDLTAIAAAQPNVLQLILAEFLMIDSNNWYLVPLELPVGHLRRIARVRAVDAFGVWRDLPPSLAAAGPGPWEVFTLSDPAGAGALDGASMFLPNVAGAIVDGRPLEEVEMVRDEHANVVWAVERYYTDAAGARVSRDDEEAAWAEPARGLAPPAALAPERRSMPVFRLARQAPRHWIPYLPRRLAPGGGAPGQVYLRRGRTDEAATAAHPQHRTTIVAESWRLEEQEVPRTGVRVRRMWRFARGIDGREHFWVGRRKEATSSERQAGVDFDFLLPP